MHAHCADPGTKQTHESQGCVEQIAGIDTYKVGQGKSAIVLFTDIFGFAFPNTRKVADRFAQETDTTVLIPDCFNGDPVDISKPNYRDLLPEWGNRHPITDTCALADKLISTIKEQYESIQVKFIHFDRINYLVYIR